VYGILSLKFLKLAMLRVGNLLKPLGVALLSLILFFADDLLLCAEASASCCHTISRSLRIFALILGKKSI
jgi:hypothetical protein